MRIALDAMGGDYAPEEIVAGGVMAAREFGLTLALVGRREVVEAELGKHDTDGLALEVVHAPEVIEMEDSPAIAAKTKRDSSMHVGMRMLKDGSADAFVTMGNSGGALATALFTLGRLPGIRRPALATIFPTIEGFTFLLDIGANADCKPEYLLQFALMGSVYSRDVLGVENPRVGIVSNGEERGKGNQLVLDTVPLLEQAPMLNFVGNVEGKDIFRAVADVVVTDGFTGNVIIKGSEGLAWMLLELIKQEVKRSPLAMAGIFLMKGALKRVLKRTDYTEYGGAPLLGVNGNVVVGHGRSNRRAVRTAVKVAKQMVEKDVLGTIRRDIEVIDSMEGR
jgi:glycerol-3-phosphate acyltransferase PlsX